VYELVNNYIGFYYALNAGSFPDNSENSFVENFESSSVQIPNDFQGKNGDEYNVGDYANLLIGLSSRKRNFKTDDALIDSMKFSNIDSVIYCKKSDCWYAWVQKFFYYRKNENDKDQVITNVSRLKIVKILSINQYRISEIKLFTKLPSDVDGDHIADKDDEGNICDVCRFDQFRPGENHLFENGCINDDIDGDGVKNWDDKCPTIKGPAKNHGCPYLPSSRLAVSLSVGAAFPIFSKFNNQDAVTSSTWDQNSSFAKTGFIVDANLHYNVYRRAGIAMGLLLVSKQIDSRHLSDQMNLFLADNGVSNAGVSVSAHSYQIAIPYVSARFGNFNATKSIVSFEPFIGIGLTDIGLFKNNFIVNYLISDSGGNNQGPQSYTIANISFKTSPFLVYGSKFNYERSLESDGRFRMLFSIFFLTGYYHYSTQEINFPGVANKVIFSGSQLNLLGGSFGVFYNLDVPKLYYASDRK
jgi:hypothetical protein